MDENLTMKNGIRPERTISNPVYMFLYNLVTVNGIQNLIKGFLELVTQLVNIQLKKALKF